MDNYDGINDLLEMLKLDDRFSEEALKIVRLLVESSFTRGRIYEMERGLKK